MRKARATLRANVRAEGRTSTKLVVCVTLWTITPPRVESRVTLSPMAEDLTPRQQSALIRQQLSDAHERAEAAKAQVLIDQFIVDAEALGLSPRPLKATTLDGHRVKTDKTGWYLRTNHSVAVDADGHYYSLVVAGGLKERLRGVTLTPTLPPLVIGRGGRDGETGDLSEFLAWTLDGTIPQT